MGGPPGIGQAPGMQQAQHHNAGGFPPNFQPPANMPDIDFKAPVIRLGIPNSSRQDPQSSRPNNFQRDSNAEPMSGRRGLGFDRGDHRRDGRRDHGRDTLSNFPPPTKEEVARTIWIANITDKFGGDEGLESILNSGGGLRRWRRVVDVNDKPATYGFAEYEDADSLNTAFEVLQNVKIPKLKPRVAKRENSETPALKNEGSLTPNGNKGDTEMHDDKPEGTQEPDGKPDDAEMPDADGDADHKSHSEGDHKVDSQMKDEDILGVKQEEPDASDDTTDKLIVIVDPLSRKYVEDWRARGSLKGGSEAQFRIDTGRDELARILQDLALANSNTNGALTNGDTTMRLAEITTESGGVVNIPIAIDDELSEIPQEARESVAKEIAGFRSRAFDRDMRRLKQKEDSEKAERQRHLDARLQPSNRDRTIEGAPLGPRAHGHALGSHMQPIGFRFEHDPDDDTSADDEELQARRDEKKNSHLDRLFVDKSRAALKHQRHKAAADNRAKHHDKNQEGTKSELYAAERTRLKQFDDDVEARRGHPFYYDSNSWYRERKYRIRGREAALDKEDREQERRENARSRPSLTAAEAAADQFLAQQSEELEARAQSRQEPARVKISFGVNPKKAETRKRRAAAVVENLLEDEAEEEDTKVKRTLVPIQDDPSRRGIMTENESAQAQRDLASEIPQDLEGVWNWNLKWSHIDEVMIAEQLRPIIEKEILKYIGLEDESLVKFIEDTLKKRGKPQELIKELAEVCF